jgi:hypothetical protein
MSYKIMCWVIYFPKEKKFFHKFSSKRNIILKSKQLRNAYFLYDKSRVIAYDAALREWGAEKFEFIKLIPDLATDK